MYSTNTYFGHPVSLWCHWCSLYITAHLKKKSLGQAKFNYFGEWYWITENAVILGMKANRMHFSCDAFLICAYPQVEERDILPVAGLAHLEALNLPEYLLESARNIGHFTERIEWLKFLTLACNLLRDESLFILPWCPEWKCCIVVILCWCLCWKRRTRF